MPHCRAQASGASRLAGTPERPTQIDCPVWTPFPGQVIAGPYRQVLGEGCVYPEGSRRWATSCPQPAEVGRRTCRTWATTRGRDHTVATARGPSCGHPGMHRLARVSSSASGWPGGPTSSMSATMPARSAWPGRIGCSPTRMTHQSPLLRCPGKPGFPPALLRRAASRWIVSIRRPAPAATPPGPGDPGQDSPLPPARLDALADRHLPIVPARSGTGRRSGADGSIVTDTPR